MKKIILIINSEVQSGVKLDGVLDVELRFVKIKDLHDCHKHIGCEYFDAVWMRPAERDMLHCISFIKSRVRRLSA